MAAAGYGEELLGRVSGLVAACTRHVSRATRRLLRRRGQRRMKKQHGQTTTTTAVAAGSVHVVAAAALCARGAAIDKGRSSSGAGEALWSRRILMGERCQPLDFAGAIHYDSFGRRLARPPMPRSASSLSCRSSPGSGRGAAADNADASYPVENENDDVDSSSS